MNSDLKKDKYIAVIELSSTAIKTLLGLPKYVNRKPSDLTRFKYPFLKPLYLSSYINSDFVLDVERYEKQILPEIFNAVKKILTEPIQSIRIILTGHYRNIKNSEEVVKLIEEKIKKFTRRKRTMVELLSSEQESFLSFYSWISTYNFEKKEKNLFDLHFFYLEKGLNVDIGGGTTEISLFRGEDFSNTLSIEIGTDSYKNKMLKGLGNSHAILLNISLADESSKIQSLVLQKLKSHFIEDFTINFSVATGSKIFLDTDQVGLNENKIPTVMIGDAIQGQSAYIDQFLYMYFNNNEPLKKMHEQSIKQFVSFSILKAVFDFFNIEDYFQNYASLRIGVYYDTMNKLKSP